MYTANAAAASPADLRPSRPAILRWVTSPSYRHGRAPWPRPKTKPRWATMPACCSSTHPRPPRTSILLIVSARRYNISRTPSPKRPTNAKVSCRWPRQVRAPFHDMCRHRRYRTSIAPRVRALCQAPAIGFKFTADRIVACSDILIVDVNQVQQHIDNARHGQETACQARRLRWRLRSDLEYRRTRNLARQHARRRDSDSNVVNG